MSAKSALIKQAYSEVQPGIFFKSATTEVWQEVDGGWACYDPPLRGWGMPQGSSDNLMLDTGTGKTEFIRVPYTVNELGEGVSGLAPKTHPQFFEWVWPEEKVEEIYKYAEPGWVKTVDENGKVKMSREA